MKEIIELCQKIIEVIINLSAEQIALFSIVITFLIYTLGKRNEIKLRKHQAKKENYLKFLQLHAEIFLSKDNKNRLVFPKDFDKKMFDVGISLLSYGSRKIYLEYILYREIASNPMMTSSKYYTKDMNLYLLGGIFKQIRKELSLEGAFISELEALSYFVNGMSNNPVSKNKLSEMKYRIRMVKFELFFADRYQFVWGRKFYYTVVKGFFSILEIIFRYVFLIPLGMIIKKMFPKFAEKEANKLD